MIAAAVRHKGQLISKADWRAIDSPKKQMNDFFAMKNKKERKNLFVRFLGESTAYQSAYGFIWPLEYVNFEDCCFRGQKLLFKFGKYFFGVKKGYLSGF